MMDTPPGMGHRNTMLDILDQDKWWRHQTGLTQDDKPEFTWSLRTELTIEHRASILAYVLRKAPDIIKAHSDHLFRQMLTIGGDSDASDWFSDELEGRGRELDDMTVDEARDYVARTPMMAALLRDVAEFMGRVPVTEERLAELQELERSLQVVRGVR